MIGNIEFNKFYNPSQNILDLYNVQGANENRRF